jgi:hypothetical protein
MREVCARHHKIAFLCDLLFVFFVSFVAFNSVRTCSEKVPDRHTQSNYLGKPLGTWPKTGVDLIKRC